MLSYWWRVTFHPPSFGSWAVGGGPGTLLFPGNARTSVIRPFNATLALVYTALGKVWRRA